MRVKLFIAIFIGCAVSFEAQAQDVLSTETVDVSVVLEPLDSIRVSTERDMDFGRFDFIRPQTGVGVYGWTSEDINLQATSEGYECSYNAAQTTNLTIREVSSAIPGFVSAEGYPNQSAVVQVRSSQKWGESGLSLNGPEGASMNVNDFGYLITGGMSIENNDRPLSETPFPTLFDSEGRLALCFYGRLLIRATGGHYKGEGANADKFGTYAGSVTVSVSYD